MQNKLISKILGVGLALGLTFSLGAAFIASPAAQADEMEWGPVNTPSWDDMVILPASDIIDYAVGEDEGDVIYSVLELSSECTEVGHSFEYDDDGDPLEEWGNFALVKSDDGGVTWSDITENVIDASSLPSLIVEPDNSYLPILTLVAVAPDDDDWLAVAGYYWDSVDAMGYVPFVVASEDGGDNFTYAHDVEAGGIAMEVIMDMAVSPETSDGIHNIALAGIANLDINGSGEGAVFRLEAGTWLTGGWEDTRCYDGWDGSDEDPCTVPATWDIYSDAVVAVDFSPNFDMDDTIVCMSVADYLPYLQEGTLDGGGAWNAEAGFSDAPLQITNEGEEILTFVARYMMGSALPADFDGVDGSANNVYLYVNGLNMVTGEIGGYVFISEDCADLSMRCGPSGDPLLASIDVHGDADTAKAVVGTLGLDVEWGDGLEVPEVEPCEGVAVWHTVELDDCCPEWECACKDPSGPTTAVVMYTPDGEKIFTSTSGSRSFLWKTDGELAYGDGWGSTLYFTDVGYAVGNPLDESAFSVSLDDGVSFNQIGLIDTDIDYLSDVAVCPDCSVIYLSTINEAVAENPHPHGAYPCPGEEYSCCDEEMNLGWFACDSVWRSYDDGDTWERIFHGDWTDDDNGWENFGDDPGQLLLRLPCDQDEECCTIYMGIQNTEDLYYSRDCGQCWNAAVNQKLTIQDFAVESENIVYILDEDGMVSISTQYGRRPSDGVDTDIGSGHSITSCCNEGFVVVGGAEGGEVAWSDDGGETWELTDELPSGAEGMVHVACDPVCEDIIYAAVDGKGIFRTDINDGEWEDMNAMAYDYTGIVVAREGTLYASSDEIIADTGVFCEDEYCDRYIEDIEDIEVVPNGGDEIKKIDNFNGYECDYEMYSGVARNLTPCETDCCGTEDWDYLIAGMSPMGEEGPCDSGEDFDQNPSALRLCGCLSPDTNSVLWAIDTYFYDVVDEGCGLLWSYEDCAAKHGPELIAPEDEAVLACDPCYTCESVPINLEWERMCHACSYDIEIMDEDGNVIWDEIDVEITGDPPTYYLDTGAIQCGQTYWWHVREANTETDECVHSPWSESWTFTIEASSSNAVRLISPENGDMLTNRSGVGFSWTSVADATSYSFVLSENPDLSSALATSDQSGTAYAYSGTLDYETTYYWQVTAWKNGTMLSQSDIATFSIAPEEVIPPAPEPGEPTVIDIPAKEQITPTYIYAIIGIGAALAAVVIVLIVRTRRP